MHILAKLVIGGSVLLAVVAVNLVAVWLVGLA